MCVFKQHRISLTDVRLKPQNSISEMIFDKCQGEFELMLHYVNKLSMFNDAKELYDYLEDTFLIDELYDLQYYRKFGSMEDLLIFRATYPIEASKAIKSGKVNISDNYIYFKDGNLYTTNELPKINYENHLEHLVYQFLKEN